MNARKCLNIFGLLIVFSLMLTACQPQQPPAIPAPVVVTSVVTQIVAGTPVEKVVEKVITATPAPPTAAPAVAATAAPKPVDSLVIALNQEPDTLHPLVGSMSAKVYVQNMYYVGCMSQNEKAEWVALGCEQVPSIDNGGAKVVGEGEAQHLEVTYKIRKDWRWTDGTPVTSKDIVYWWHLHMDPKFSDEGRSTPEKIYDIKVVDDHTVVVSYMTRQQVNDAVAGKLKGNVDFAAFKDDYAATFSYTDDKGNPTPWPYYAVDPVYWANIGWLPDHVLTGIPGDQQESSAYARKPVGDGPYVVTDWKGGQEIVLTKSDKPFPLGDPKINTVTFRFFGDTAGVLAALQNGEVDAAMGNVAGLTEANGQDLDAIEKAGKIKVDWISGYSFEHIDLNMTKFPTNDLSVRRALYMAIDRQRLSDALYFGKKVITDLPLPKGLSWAYPPDSDLTTYKYDVDGAKKLLADAGWDCSAMPCTKQDKDGKTVKLEFTLMTTDRSDRERLAQIIQSMWKAINVGVNLQFLYGRGLFATCASGGPLNCMTYNAAIYTTSTDDSATMYSSYSCAQVSTQVNNWSGQNWPGWCNQQANDALNQSENNPANAVSHEKRLPFLNTFFKEMTQDVPVIILYGSAEPFPHDVNWKNFKTGPTQFSYSTWNSWEWEVSK